VRSQSSHVTAEKRVDLDWVVHAPRAVPVPTRLDGRDSRNAKKRILDETRAYVGPE
jgi:hypothetical protein